jgi:hypothetical protein
VNSLPPKPEVILTNFFAEPTVLLVPITSRVYVSLRCSYDEVITTNNATIVVTIWLTVTIHRFLKWRWIFYFLRRCSLSSITAKTFTGLGCIYGYHGRCFIRSRNCLSLTSTCVHPRFFSGVRVSRLFSFLCCSIMCHYGLSSVLWCPLRYPHKNDVRFVFTSSCSCLIYVICVCLCIVVSNTYCVVFLLCLSSSCVPYVANFSGLSIFDSLAFIYSYIDIKETIYIVKFQKENLSMQAPIIGWSWCQFHGEA